MLTDTLAPASLQSVPSATQNPRGGATSPVVATTIEWLHLQKGSKGTQKKHPETLRVENAAETGGVWNGILGMGPHCAHQNSVRWIQSIKPSSILVDANDCHRILRTKEIHRLGDNLVAPRSGGSTPAFMRKLRLLPGAS